MKFKSLVLSAAIALALASCSSSKTTLPDKHEKLEMHTEAPGIWREN